MKKIWMLNHYATTEYAAKGGRPYYISGYLKEAGYEPEIFCASTLHKTGEQYLELNEKTSIEKKASNDVNYIFVKARSYQGNGKQRILNMIDYYRNVIKVIKKRAKETGKPDIIYASSVHPLALVAGIKIAAKFKIKCICEIRDLWPESLIAYGILKRNSVIAKILYYFEKRIYKKADKIIMTWPGGYDYIKDRGWDKAIPQSKVVCVSNGVDLDLFMRNLANEKYTDQMLQTGKKNFIYAGSVRQVNNLDLLVRTAKILNDKRIDDVELLIYGDGNEREELIQKAKEMQLDNIQFVGSVNKEQVPALLSQAYATILHNSSTSLDKYGQSQNKFFEYLAAGKPILMTYSVGHSICKENNCGLEVSEQTPEEIANAIIRLSTMTVDEYGVFCANCIATAKQYDYRALTDIVIGIIQEFS